MVKIFARDPIDKVEYLPPKFRGFIDLVRPFTLTAPLIGGTSGALIAWGYMHDGVNIAELDLLTLVYGVGTLMALNAASNSLNQVYDLEIDRINKPYRPIPSGVVTREEALTFAWILYVFTLFRAALINLWFAGFILLIMLLTFIYSMPPIRLKESAWGSNFVIALARGVFGFVAAWSIFASPLNATPWVIGSIITIYLIGATTTKDFTDVEGDRKFGVRTLPVIYGTRRTAIMISPFFILPFVLIPLGILSNALKPTTINLVGLTVWGIYVVFKLQSEAEVPDKMFENSPVWKHMYLILLALQLGFCLAYVNPIINLEEIL